MTNYTKRSTYNYYLPEELIAQYPSNPRDASRLMVFNRENKEIKHKKFYDIIDYLNEGDVLVLNNTKVIPARLFGVKEVTGAKIEILLQKRLNLTDWEVIAKPFKRLKIGTIVVFNEELKMCVKELLTDGVCVISFIYSGNFEEVLDKIGLMPLPPYITKKLENKDDYQTIYAKERGSSAALNI